MSLAEELLETAKYLLRRNKNKPTQADIYTTSCASYVGSVLTAAGVSGLTIPAGGFSAGKLVWQLLQLLKNP